MSDNKLPAFQFYPGDWKRDVGVQALNLHDRMVWFEMLLLMHESEQRGKLLLNGRPMPEDVVAQLIGVDKQTLQNSLSTILSYGVCSVDEETGAYMCRRMVRDESVRQQKKKAGRMGGNPVLLKQVVKQEDKQNPTTGVKQNGGSSSSSSSSTSVDKAPPSDDSDPPKQNVVSLSNGYKQGAASDGFDAFRVSAEEYGMRCSGEEWKECHQFEWRSLDVMQRMEAFKGIRDRVEAGDMSLVNVIPKNYLKRRLWERNVIRKRPIVVERDPYEGIRNYSKDPYAS